MSLKDIAKSALPSSLIPPARGLYRLLDSRHYYFPYLFRNGRANAPKELKFEITFRCNLRCVMCPLASQFDDPNSQIVQEWKREKELTTEEIYKMIMDAKELGVKYFGITGGEPFIRKDLIDIISYSKIQGIRCGVLSNGVLIDQAMAERIVASGLDVLQFSLDGPKDIHNKIRKHHRGYESTLDAAHWITEAKKKAGKKRPLLSFCCTISAANIGHLLPLIDVAHEFDASISFGYLFYTTDEMIEQTNMILHVGSAKGEDQDISNELKAVDAQKLYEEVSQVKEYAGKIGVKATFEPDLKGDEIKRRFYDDTYAYVDKCFYPWYGTRVNPYGVVYPCSMNVSLGNIRQTPLYQIWNNKAYVDFRCSLKEHKLFPKCVKCCKLNNKLWNYLPSFNSL